MVAPFRLHSASGGAACLLLTLSLAACSSGKWVDPWADDPFADAAAPDVGAEASYPDPATDAQVSWEGWVSGFSNVYCVDCHNPQAACGGSGCHTPGNPQINALLFDMREKSSWTDHAATIHCGIVATQDPAWNCNVPAETFPKLALGLPLPTNVGREAVADWIEAGCP